MSAFAQRALIGGFPPDPRYGGRSPEQLAFASGGSEHNTLRPSCPGPLGPLLSQSPLYSGRPSVGIRHASPLLLLSPPNPLRWALAGTPIMTVWSFLPRGHRPLPDPKLKCVCAVRTPPGPAELWLPGSYHGVRQASCGRMISAPTKGRPVLRAGAARRRLYGPLVQRGLSAGGLPLPGKFSAANCGRMGTSAPTKKLPIWRVGTGVLTGPPFQVRPSP